MTSSKSAFQRNKELFDSWAAVCKQAWFSDVLIHARSDMMEGGTTEEQMRGASRFIGILMELCDAEPAPAPIPKTGLIHDLDIRKGVKETAKPK